MQLGASSAEVGEVIKMITAIAKQTDLLALNATIEAARAGTAGRGFGVVANEVKALARETAEATDNISQKIEAIQAASQSAAAAIAEISTVINQINGFQNTIAAAVEEQNASTHEISQSVAAAAKGSSDIARGITGSRPSPKAPRPAQKTPSGPPPSWPAWRPNFTASSRTAPDRFRRRESASAKVVRHVGIEPTSQAWEAHVLPMN